MDDIVIKEKDGKFIIQMGALTTKEMNSTDLLAFISEALKPLQPYKPGSLITLDGSVWILKKEIFNGSRFLYDVTPVFNAKVLTPVVLLGCCKRVKLSTKEEIDFFNKKLNECGLTYDSEKQTIVNNRWKPLPGEKYYKPYLDGNATSLTWGRDHNTDQYNWDNNLIFKTKEEAQDKASKIKNILKQ